MNSTTSDDVINVNLIVGVVSSCFLVISWSGILIHGKSVQHRNTHFQCGSELSDLGYVHIVAFTIYDAVA